MNHKDRVESGDLWSDYWLTGHRDACTAEFPEACRNAIAENWRQEFARLKNGASILDVATGKGALIGLASQVAGPDRRLSAVGVDLAQITGQDMAVDEDAQLEVSFQGEIDAVNLPFDDRTFTLVVSQFGIEYSDFEKAVTEACRVARKRLVALVHAAESPVVRQNGRIPEQVEWLQEELGLFAAAEAHFRTESPETKERLSGISAAIRKKCESMENPDFLVEASHYMGQLIIRSGEMELDQTLAFLSGMEKQLTRHAERMKSLVAAARSNSDLRRAAELCIAAGFESTDITAEIAEEYSEPVGHWLKAQRKNAKQV